MRKSPSSESLSKSPSSDTLSGGAARPVMRSSVSAPELSSSEGGASRVDATPAVGPAKGSDSAPSSVRSRAETAGPPSRFRKAAAGGAGSAGSSGRASSEGGLLVGRGGSSARQAAAPPVGALSPARVQQILARIESHRPALEKAADALSSPVRLLLFALLLFVSLSLSPPLSLSHVRACLLLPDHAPRTTTHNTAALRNEQRHGGAKGRVYCAVAELAGAHRQPRGGARPSASPVRVYARRDIA